MNQFPGYVLLPREGPLKRRTLGRTNFEISEIGYGAWGIGGTMWIGASD